jgi:hypothetical protein
MGIGKTTISISTCHVQHIYNLMHAEISKHPYQHYPSSGGQACLVNMEMLKTFGFDCPCAPTSPGHAIGVSLGINLILVPLSLIETWHTEWTRCYQDMDGSVTKANPFKMKIVIGHASARAANKNEISGSHNVKEAEILNLGDPNNVTDLPVCKARIENSRVMCITTSNSLRTQVFDKFYKEKRVQYQPKGTEKRRPNTDENWDEDNVAGVDPWDLQARHETHIAGIICAAEAPLTLTNAHFN